MGGGGKGQGRGLETARYVKDMGAANGVVRACVCVCREYVCVSLYVRDCVCMSVRISVHGGVCVFCMGRRVCGGVGVCVVHVGVWVCECVCVGWEDRV